MTTIEGNKDREMRSKCTSKLAISYRPVSSLHLDPRNSRVHSKKQIRQLARSIDVFDFLVPVLIDARGRIIAGHGRVLAAQHLGISEIPTISVEHLTDSQIDVYDSLRLVEKPTLTQRILKFLIRIGLVR